MITTPKTTRVRNSFIFHAFIIWIVPETIFLINVVHFPIKNSTIQMFRIFC